MTTPDPPADDGDDGGKGDDDSDDGKADCDDADDEIDALLAAFELKDERRTGWQLRGVSDPETVADHSWGVAYLLLAVGDRIAEELVAEEFVAEERAAEERAAEERAAEERAKGKPIEGDAGDGATNPTEALIDRALRLAVVHDVAEAVTGDVATRADSSAVADGPTGDAKVAAERAAVADLAGPLPDRIGDAWEAYEARDSPEAVLVKECDLIDLCLQALAYERADRYDPSDGDPDAFREYDDLDEFFATAEPRLRTDAGRAIVARIRRRYEAAREEE